jgi:hypothetical protein
MEAVETAIFLATSAQQQGNDSVSFNNKIPPPPQKPLTFFFRQLSEVT